MKQSVINFIIDNQKLISDLSIPIDDIVSELMKNDILDEGLINQHILPIVSGQINKTMKNFEFKYSEQTTDTNFNSRQRCQYVINFLIKNQKKFGVLESHIYTIVSKLMEDDILDEIKINKYILPIVGGKISQSVKILKQKYDTSPTDMTNHLL